MRAPLSWINEFSPLVAGSTVDDVHAALVSVGLEEEDLHGFELSGPIVVGQVLDFVEEPQSNGKTIRWCQVRVAADGEPAADGGEAVHGIVCGASNFQVGDKVVVTLPGAVLPGPFPIAARKTYGHVSDGMMASGKELGLSDDHGGIIRLVELGLDPEVGTDALELLGLNDSAVEVNVTPDRGYAFSLRGIAREYAHATGQPFTDPAALVTVGEASGFPVVLDDQAPIRGRVGCRGFVARVVRGVNVNAPTPPWLVARLRLAGVRSISLPVDITNYVMFELGQPTHAYDLDTLHGGITVRRARDGETLVTLDETTRTLHPEDLLICDESGPIGLAGVMGGASTEISDGTTNVLIEAATFDPVSIARSARRHKLPSEASKRFERGVDPALGAIAAERVAQLLVDLAGGVRDDLGATIAAPTERDVIELPAQFTSGIIGVHYEAEQIRQSLSEIGCTVRDGGEGFLVTPPSWRPDLTDKWTLAEEVARIQGYGHIPAVLPVAPPGRGLTRAQRLRRQVANALAANGFTETVAYPFFDEDTNQLFGSATGETIGQVKLANALDSRTSFLRTSLLPGLTQVAHRNLSRGLTDLALFETGSVFRPEAGVSYGTASIPPGAVKPSAAELAELQAAIPPQPRLLSALVLGNRTAKQPGQSAVVAGIADALEAARVAAWAVGAELEIVQGSHQALHPGRTAELLVNGEHVGFAGELRPDLALEADLPRTVGVVEINLDRLIELAPALVEAEPIATFPAATQDLSLVVATDVAAAALAAAIELGAGELLEAISLVDDYRGSGVPEGHKSVTFALRFRAADRTLTAAEASDAKLAGAARATELFGATIREQPATMAGPAIDIRDLQVRRGGRDIVHGLDLRIPSGRITGLLGPSGGGKTTLMRAIVGSQRISDGTVSVLGRPAGSRELRRTVGYVTQAASVYDDLTVRQNVSYFARIVGASRTDIDRVITQVDLGEYLAHRVDRLSGGQRNRVSLAVALLGDPQLLILDEPTVGLDPVLRRDLWNIFRALADAGKTLLVSSHVMDEAARCDDLILLRDGAVVAHDTPANLLARTHTNDYAEAFLAIIEGRAT